jgi:hypothetical protein
MYSQNFPQTIIVPGFSKSIPSTTISEISRISDAITGIPNPIASITDNDIPSIVEGWMNTEA